MYKHAGYIILYLNSYIIMYAKVFETYLMLYLQQNIIADNLQFGFVSNKGCQKNLLMFSSLVDYFNQRDHH